MTFLENVAVQVIVRDEENNASGTLKRFVDHYANHVEELWILDTMSKNDKTYEILKDMQSKHQNLIVPKQIEFQGFSHARNYLLKQTAKSSRCKWRLVVDRDELFPSKIPEDSFEKMNKLVREHNFYAFKFKRVEVYSGDNFEMPFQPMHPRLFHADSNPNYINLVWEVLTTNCKISSAPWVQFYHFHSSKDAMRAKFNTWYESGDTTNFSENIKNGITPSGTAKFNEWKKYNPNRDNYE